MRTIYLNRTGHRWKNFYELERLVPEKVAVFFPETGLVKLYTVAFWEAIGNFAIPYCKIKGRLEQLTESPKEGCFMINSKQNREFLRQWRLSA